MAKLRMKKIELIALLTDSKKIIELLQRRGVVELSGITDEELTETNVSAVVGEFEKFRSTVAQALEVLDKYAPEKASIADMFGGRTEVEKHEFGREAMNLEKIMDTAGEIIGSSRNIADSEQTISQLTVKCDTLSQWTALDVPFDFKGTATTAAFIGTLPYQADTAAVEEMLPAGSSAEVISSTKDQTNLFVLVSRQNAQEAEDILRRNGFAAVSDPDSETPAELIRSYTKQIETLEKGIESSQASIERLSPERRELQFAIDYLQMRKDKYEALSSLGFTESTFVLNGYIPEKFAEPLRKEIEARFTAALTFTDPGEDDDVPVLLENGRFSAPVEGITKMYAMPSKSDVDPTPVMSFFYYLFFGMMLSDAGYGLVMVIGTMIALKKFRLEDSMRKTLTMFRNCGISTVIWGALFGSWFGDIVQVVGREFFHTEVGSIALWFEPIDDPIKLLLFSFGLGILHLFLGVAVSFKMSWDEGKKVGAFLDTVPVYLIILGVAPLGASILTEVPALLKTVGSYLLIAGVILLVLTAGRSSKSIFGKFFGGLYALYNTATGWLSDILSYSRLLALGLATGSIAGVINLMGSMPSNIVVKAIVLVIVFIVGHTANLAINLLGAYVHTDRLQFVELFSKFYTGGGREFSPLTVNTKYIKFKEENFND
ncbi:MAG: V-type ATP synthase subunit I [Ruminococcus sp.]|nr:V-type ATP synthase subunit I [Ruminococcus sp.]